MGDTDMNLKEAVIKVLDELESDQIAEVLDFATFLKARPSSLAKKITVKTLPASHLENLRGLISIGGDAVEDSDQLYDEDLSSN